MRSISFILQDCDTPVIHHRRSAVVCITIIIIINCAPVTIATGLAAAAALRPWEGLRLEAEGEEGFERGLVFGGDNR